MAPGAADAPSAVKADAPNCHHDANINATEGGGTEGDGRLPLTAATEASNGIEDKMREEIKSSSNSTHTKTRIEESLTFRNHRSNIRNIDGSNNASSGDDDDDSLSDDHHEEQAQVGAVAVPGRGSNAAAVQTVADDYTVEQQIVISNGGNGNDDINDEDEGNLIRAELAPEVYDATWVEAVDNKDSDEDDGRNDKYRRRRNVILLAVVGVATAVGLGIGFAVGGSDTQSEPINTTDPTSLASTSTDPYLEPVSFRGRNEDWNCTFDASTIDFLGGGETDYACEFQPPNRTFAYPFADYNTFLYCECPDGPIDEENPPNNDRCDCIVFFSDFSLPCLWTQFVETNETEFFQITFSCFNVFASVLDEALDKSCVGRDPQGACISNTDTPMPPTKAIQTGNSEDLTCLNITFDDAAGFFPILRGRRQCNSAFGLPFPDTLVSTSLFCTEQGYFDNNDCNCAVFLWTQNFEFACHSCEVIPNGSNETFQIAYNCLEWFGGDCVGYTANGTCLGPDDRPEVCTYYDVKSCRDKALELGLHLGGAEFTFAGDYITKGCQFYESDHPLYGNRAYFGTGEFSRFQLEMPPLEGNRRLECDTELDDPPATQVCELLDAESCRSMAESRGLQAGNEFFPFTSASYIPGCYYLPNSADPSRANTAFFGDLREDPLEIFLIPINGPLRFFCNVTGENTDIDIATEVANSSVLLPP